MYTTDAPLPEEMFPFWHADPEDPTGEWLLAPPVRPEHVDAMSFTDRLLCISNLIERLSWYTRPVSLSTLRSETLHNEMTIGHALALMVRSGAVVRDSRGRGWSLAMPTLPIAV